MLGLATVCPPCKSIQMEEGYLDTSMLSRVLPNMGLIFPPWSFLSSKQLPNPSTLRKLLNVHVCEVAWFHCFFLWWIIMVCVFSFVWSSMFSLHTLFLVFDGWITSCEVLICRQPFSSYEISDEFPVCSYMIEKCSLYYWIGKQYGSLKLLLKFSYALYIYCKEIKMQLCAWCVFFPFHGLQYFIHSSQL